MPVSPREPLFHTGCPLVGALQLEDALCSMVTLGFPDATRLVNPPERTDGARPLEQVCGGAAPAAAGRHLVRVDTAEYGPVDGHLHLGSGTASGLLVLFTGLGMPAAGWINERFAEKAQVAFLAFHRHDGKTVIGTTATPPIRHYISKST